jgi:hypothetical protein
MGVWLPLALADLATLMFASIRMWAAKPDAVKVPRRSELLKGWALPFMALALEAEEKEQEALALFTAVKNLKAKQEAKNADQVHQ